MKRLGSILVATLASCVVSQPPPNTNDPSTQQPVSATSTGGTDTASADGDVVAKGQYATLSRDDATAFLEALAFCLQTVGQTELVARIDTESFLRAMAVHYPQADAEIQQNLANARQLWNEVQAAWPMMGQEEQQEFVYEVLALGIGEPAARQLTGMGGGTPSGGQGGSASSGSVGGISVDAPYEGSDCWAAAGCADYDSGSGTYTFEEPPMPDPSY